MKKIAFVMVAACVSFTQLAGAEAPDEQRQKGYPAFSCSVKKTCKQMRSCEEARFYLTQCGVKRLDRDKDGIPCESIC